jgi:hypothetical protein
MFLTWIITRLTWMTSRLITKTINTMQFLNIYRFIFSKLLTKNSSIVFWRAFMIVLWILKSNLMLFFRLTCCINFLINLWKSSLRINRFVVFCKIRISFNAFFICIFKKELSERLSEDIHFDLLCWRLLTFFFCVQKSKWSYEKSYALFLDFDFLCTNSYLLLMSECQAFCLFLMNEVVNVVASQHKWSYREFHESNVASSWRKIAQWKITKMKTKCDD